jgi:hypothetical protein
MLPVWQFFAQKMGENYLNLLYTPSCDLCFLRDSSSDFDQNLTFSIGCCSIWAQNWPIFHKMSRSEV